MNALALFALLAAALPLAGCSLPTSGFSLCRATDAMIIPLSADVKDDEIRAEFRADGWTVNGSTLDVDVGIFQGFRVWNASVLLTGGASRTTYSTSGGNATFVNVHIEAASTATTNDRPPARVADLEAPLVAKLRAMGEFRPATAVPVTAAASTDWDCIHGD